MAFRDMNHGTEKGWCEQLHSGSIRFSPAHGLRWFIGSSAVWGLLTLCTKSDKRVREQRQAEESGERQLGFLLQGRAAFDSFHGPVQWGLVWEPLW